MRWYVSIGMAIAGVALIAGVVREDALVDARADAIAEAQAAARAATNGYEVVLPPGLGLAPDTDPTSVSR